MKYWAFSHVKKTPLEAIKWSSWGEKLWAHFGSSTYQKKNCRETSAYFIHQLSSHFHCPWLLAQKNVIAAEEQLIYDIAVNVDDKFYLKHNSKSGVIFYVRF